MKVSPLVLIPVHCRREAKLAFSAGGSLRVHASCTPDMRPAPIEVRAALHCVGLAPVGCSATEMRASGAHPAGIVDGDLAAGRGLIRHRAAERSHTRSSRASVRCRPHVVRTALAHPGWQLTSVVPRIRSTQGKRRRATCCPRNTVSQTADVRWRSCRPGGGGFSDVAHRASPRPLSRRAPPPCRRAWRAPAPLGVMRREVCWTNPPAMPRPPAALPNAYPPLGPARSSCRMEAYQANIFDALPRKLQPADASGRKGAQRHTLLGLGIHPRAVFARTMAVEHCARWSLLSRCGRPGGRWKFLQADSWCCATGRSTRACWCCPPTASSCACTA